MAFKLLLFFMCMFFMAVTSAMLMEAVRGQGLRTAADLYSLLGSAGITGVTFYMLGSEIVKKIEDEDAK